MIAEVALAIALVVAVLVFAGVAWLALRSRVIARHGGIIECGLRQAPGAKWHDGLAEFQRSQLCWHPAVTLRLRPRACFDRAGLAIVRSRRPTTAEAARFGVEIVIAECEVRRVRAPGSGERQNGGIQPVELAMSHAAFTGLLAWLESSPQFHLRAS
ncbi:MAG TPA: DUF2550 family protein [Streptosporangiaceae bacterium]|nr:DUF2550 family protein [Streptosporangiaceae bacterium]